MCLRHPKIRSNLQDEAEIPCYAPDAILRFALRAKPEACVSMVLRRQRPIYSPSSNA
jgi:hypothetical protein